MIIYKLPDLGEGLPDAIIREWYVQPGDAIKADQPIVAMETAKALVEVPAPFHGKVEKLFGKIGDTIETGQPLIGFEGEGQEEVKGGHAEAKHPPVEKKEKSKAKATPAVRALAKKLGVNLDEMTAQGDFITQAEVEQAAAQSKAGSEALSPARRAMVLAMTESHHKIVPITISDDADIAAWEQGQDTAIPAEISGNSFVGSDPAHRRSRLLGMKGRIAVLPLTIPHRVKRSSLHRELLSKILLCV